MPDHAPKTYWSLLPSILFIFICVLLFQSCRLGFSGYREIPPESFERYILIPSIMRALELENPGKIVTYVYRAGDGNKPVTIETRLLTIEKEADIFPRIKAYFTAHGFLEIENHVLVMEDEEINIYMEENEDHQRLVKIFLFMR